MIKAKLDASEVMRQYSTALRRLSELTGFSQKQVLLSEAGVILKTWAGRTKVSTEKKTDLRTINRSFGKNGLQITTATNIGDVTVNEGIRGPFGWVWVKTRQSDQVGRKGAAGKPFKFAGTIHPTTYQFRPMNYHWKRGTWIDIQEVAADVRIALAKNIPRGRQSIGLSRQSVIQIADDLGIDLGSVKGGGTLAESGIAKARAAMASTGHKYKNGSGRAFVEGHKDVLDLLNKYPRVQKMGMDRELLYIISGRAKFFQQSYAKGAFNSMRNTAKSYPWLTVQAAA